MTVSDQLALVGASAPACLEEVPLDLVGILEMDVSGLLDAELIERIRATYAIQALTGVLRAKYLREIRDRNFPITGRVGKTGDASTRKGWPQWLGQVFPSVRINEANQEIIGLEHLEAAHKALPAAKSSDFGSRPADPRTVPEISSTVLQELGRANGVGPAVAKKLLTGEAPATKRGVRAAVAQAKTDAGKVALKAAPPPKPPEVSKGLPKMKPGTKASFGPAKELSKAKYGYLPEQKKERDYLIGSATANDRMIEDLKALRAKHRSSGAGKMTRISALAQALHAEFKSLGERYHGAWDKARDYPSYMTLWQHIWSEEEGYELHKELEAVNNDLSDMMRHFWIAGRHLYTEDFEVLP